MNQSKKPLVYTLVMFKLEGHQTWRINTEASLSKETKMKVTEKKFIIIDRITGEIIIKK